MVKAVIFDMFETLITHYESPLYMGRQIADDIGISENKFREIWNASEEERTLGKRTFEDVIEEILRVNHRYSEELFDKILQKRIQSKIECFHHIHPEIIQLFQELETAKELGMTPIQATWYLKEEIPQMQKRKAGFVQAEMPMDIQRFMLRLRRNDL